MGKKEDILIGNVIFSNKWYSENWLFKNNCGNITFAPIFKRWIFQSGDRFNDYAYNSKLFNSIKENHESIEMNVQLNYNKHNKEIKIDNDLNLKINPDVINSSYHKILFKHGNIEEIWFYHIYHSNIWFIDILEPFSDLNNIINSSPMELLVNEIYFDVLKNIFDSYGFNALSNLSESMKRLAEYSEKQFSFKYYNGVIMNLNPK